MSTPDLQKIIDACDMVAAHGQTLVLAPEVWQRISIELGSVKLLVDAAAMAVFIDSRMESPGWVLTLATALGYKPPDPDTPRATFKCAQCGSDRLWSGALIHYTDCPKG